MVLLVVTATDLLAEDFVENFSDSSFIDLALTTANVSTEDQAVYLRWSNGQTHRLPNSNSSGTPVGGESDNTLSVAFADVDGDGDLDLVAGNNGETNKLYLNDGIGGFDASGTAIGSDTDNTRSVAFADVDGDGDIDLVAGNYNQTNKLYLNDGAGGFDATGTAIGSETDNTWSIAFVDVDGDGDVDLVAGNYNQTNKLYLNDGAGGFDATGTAIGGETDNTLSVAFADVDGDGDVDLVAGNNGETNKLYLNDGAGGFDTTGTVIGSETDNTLSVAFVDVDGDGDVDLVAGNNGETNKLYLNNGAGGFDATGTAIGSETDNTLSVAFADVDGDGDVDLVAGNNGETNKLYLNDGAGGFDATGTAIGSETDNTLSVAFADVDGDGDLELLAGNNGEANKLYLNDGAGGFDATGTAIGSETDNTLSVAFADVDGDGDVDLVAGNNGETNKLYLNDGAGGFDATGTAIGSDTDNTRSVAFADVDGDGDIDLVAGNNGETNKLYFNNGAGDFDATGAAIGSESDNTLSVAFADVDGDGDVDLVAGNNGETNKLYLNDGAGGFDATGAAIGVETNRTRSIAFADVDGDGDVDLVAGNSNQTNKLYLNDGAGGFSATGTAIGSESDTTRSIAFADVDGDGDVDLVAGNNGETNKLYLNDGAGGFDATGTAIGSESDNARSIAFADVDGDGDVDLVAGNSNQTNKLYLNDGAGGFDANGTAIGSESDNTPSVAFADVDGDGDVDLVAGNYNQTNKLYLNNGAGGFDATGAVAGGETDNTWSIAFADVDGDGDVDLVAGNYNQTNKLYLNNGAGGFDATGAVAGGETDNTWSIAFADVDGDGDVDLVAGNNGETNKLYLNDGAGGFDATGAAIGVETNRTRSIAFADVDGDGDVDLVAGNSNQTNKLYLNDGAGGFSATGTAIGSESDTTRSIAFADVDGDGDVDLVAGNQNQTNKLYLNDGAGGFDATGTAIGSESDTTRSIAFADVDGDGDVDLVAGNYNQTNKLYLNDGAGGFDATGAVAGGETDNTWSIAFADVDGDGDVDLVAGNNGETNKLYLNDGAGGFDATGTAIGSETDNTLSVAFADVDGDGDVDLVAGNNGETNKLYKIISYDINLGYVYSDKVNGSIINITSITLQTTAVINTNQTRNTSIDYLTTNNGGSKWHKVVPGIQFNFPDNGTDDVRWRANLKSLSPVRSPELSEISLAFVITDTTAPIITSGTTGTDLAENSGAGQTVYSITATDAEGVDSYAIGGTDASLLSVNSSTGVVSLTANPDYETKSSYSFTVTASDAAGNTSAATPVSFSIADVDDTAPTITSGTTGTDLAENSGVGQTVYSITATDAEGVDSYAIGGTDASLLSVNSSTGVVSLTANPDYETKSSYSFTVTASDAAGNTSAATPVSFSIADVDDTAPTITSGTTGTDLAENSGVGQTVYSITATDAEGVDSYAIGGTDASLLSLTGSVVTLNANPDYETKSSYSFTVTASDAAGNTSAATPVSFSIADVDDTAPTITSGTTGTDLAENSGVGQTVYSITATDAEGVDSYAIGGTDASLLSVNSSTGVVSLTANPDYETKSSYSFTVTASDAAGNTSAATPVSFSIADVDDTAPTITSGTTGTDLAENSGVGQTVYSITATDAEGVDSYAIGGTDASLLSVNSSTGVVSLTANPDYETKSSYSFTVTASDAAGNTSAATPVSFSIADVDDTAPTITSGTTGTDLAENSGVGQTVYSITATDAEGVDSYAIGGTDASLLSLTGSVVTLNANPDYETKSSYSFTVTASDAAGNTSAATPVIFSITDADEIAPVITLTGDASITLEVGDSFIDPGATATDTVDGVLTDSIVVTGSVDTAVIGEYTLTYNVTDAANNAATPVTRTVVVSDTTAPVITLTGDSSITLEVGDSFTDPGATASDTVDGDLTVDITVTGSVNTAAAGTYTLIYKVSDEAGNAAMPVTRTVVVSDTTAPMITLTGDASITLEVGDSFTDPGATATDAVDGVLTDSIVVTGSVNTAAAGTYTLIYKVSDEAGNEGTATRTVNVVDTTAPVITLTGDSSITLEVGDSFIDPGATASDTVDGDLTVDITVTGSVNTAAAGTYTLTYNVSDTANNAATQVTRTVVVSDTTAPVITLTGDSSITLEVGDSFTDPGATATDTVDGVLTDSIVVTGSVNTAAAGTYTLIYNVSDEAGNAATQVTRTVVVSDTTAPVITLTGDSSITLEVGDSFTDPGATATDTVDGVLTDSIVVTGSVNTAAAGTYTLTYNVSDTANNAATQVTRTVVVSDTTAPVITLTGDSSITLEVGDSFTDPGATATDTVDGVLTDSIVVTGSVNTAAAGTYTLTYNVSDTANNAATQVTRTVVVSDTTAPVITLTGDSSITLEVGDSFTDPGATATDTVDGVLTDSIVVTGSVNTAAAGTYTLTYNVSDTANNAATQVTRTVVVSDTTAPVITLTGDSSITLEVGDSFTDPGATATDAVDGDLTANITVTGSVNTAAAGTYTLIYNVSDEAGNEGTATRTVNVVDTTAPVITLTGDASITLEVGDSFTDPGATATDTVDGVLTDSIVVTGSVNTAAAGTYTLIYNVSDEAGNAATQVTRTVVVSDTTAPVITLTGDSSITLEVGDSFTDPGATATDTVDGVLTDSIVVTGSVNTAAAGTYTLTYNVSDTANNAATQVTRTVVVSDTTAPVITLTGDSSITLEVGDSFTDPGATATDTVDGVLTDSIVVTGSVNTAAAGTYTLTYNVSDEAGNAATQVTRTVVVSDTTAPVITLTGDSSITLEVGDSFTDPGATASDTVDGVLTDSIVVTGSVNTAAAGTYTLTYNVSDTANNAATQVTRTVVVSDTTAPVITLTGDSSITLEVGDSFTDPGATATDTVDGVLTDSIVVTGSVNTAAAGTYTLTYNVSDTANNAATQVTRTVVVSDTTAPVITLTGDSSITLEVGDSFIDPGATASDTVDGDLTVDITVTGSVNTAAAGTYTLIYNVSDEAGNEGTATRTVNVVDTTAPVITLTGDASITLEVGDSFTDPGATATDTVDGVLTDSIVVTGSVNTAAAGTYTLIYNVSDEAGNAATQVTRTVVVSDTTAPVITLTGDSSITLEVGDSFTDPGATATDTVDGVLTDSIVVTGSVNTAAAGTYTLTYNVSDTANNAATQVTRTVVVSDTTAPVITLTGDSSITLEVGDSFTDPGATATDTVDGVLTDSIVVTGSVNTAAAGTYTLTYNVSDTANNAATQVTRTVVVSDTTAPVITLTGDSSITLEVGDSFTDPGATATDAVDGDLTANITVTGSVNTAAAGTYTLIYNVSDEAGNEGTATRTVNVVDTTAPVITLTGDASITLEVGDSFTDPGATATDTVDGVLTDSIVVTGSVNTAAAGTYTLTYKVSDEAGNAATQVTRTVVVSDTTAPVITLTGDASITLEVGDSFTDPGATATDAVDGDLTANITVTGSVNTAAAGTYTLIYNVSDEAGNEGTATRTVNVVDTTAPVITLTGDASITLEVGDSFTDPGATATDTVDGVLTDSIVVTGSVNTAAAGTYTLTYKVSDEAGNAATPVTRTVVVSDTTAPVITLTGDASITLEVGDSFTDPGATATDAVDGDLTANITVTGSVDTAVVGEYTLTYNVTDAANNAATEIIRTINVEPVPITLIIPEDITVTATGYLTVVDLDPNDVASTVDGDGNSLAISTDQTGPFRSGTHEIVWSVSDGSRTVSEIQIVKVIPLVTIAAAPVVEEGASVVVEFLLSGDAADYPVTIPFSISGTAVQGEDYSIDVGDIVTFDKGTVGRFTLNLNVDEDLEGQETIEISLGEPTNAVAGLLQQQVITIVEENVAPQLSFVVSQSNASGEVVIGTTVAANGADVTVIPVVDDPNLNDTHVVDWSDALSSLPSALVDSETQSLSFSAETMLGVYSLTATVTDSGNPPYDVSDTVSVNVIASAPVLADDEDTDGDGISDSEEGVGDSDGDNVPDYLDPIPDPSILLVNNDQQVLMSTVPSSRLSLGVSALQRGDHNISVPEDFLVSQGVTADMGYDFPVDLVDFVATGAESGYSYPIVYSLGENVIPENATYRKYMGDNLGWQDFVEDSANEVRSTYAEQGACPAASADHYSAGLVAGHNCVFLLIEDGGPNDVDGEANGTLVDPGGVAVKYIGVPSENSQVALGKYTLVANGTDTTTITVWAYDDQQLPLEHMQVTARMDIPGVTVSDFVDRGDGRYTATITAGNISGNGPVRVVIDNGDVAVTLFSDALTLTAVPVVKSSGGGCTVANEPSNDASLLVILGALLLLLIRRRHMLNMNACSQC